MTVLWVLGFVGTEIYFLITQPITQIASNTIGAAIIGVIVMIIGIVGIAIIYSLVSPFLKDAPQADSENAEEIKCVHCGFGNSPDATKCVACRENPRH